jgi:hypothetical protein
VSALSGTIWTLVWAPVWAPVWAAAEGDPPPATALADLALVPARTVTDER